VKPLDGAEPLVLACTSALTGGLDLVDLIVLFAIGGCLARTATNVVALSPDMNRQEVWRRTNRLVCRGLIRSDRDNVDRRLHNLDLTPEGRKIAERIIKPLRNMSLYVDKDSTEILTIVRQPQNGI